MWWRGLCEVDQCCSGELIAQGSWRGYEGPEVSKTHFKAPQQWNAARIKVVGQAPHVSTGITGLYGSANGVVQCQVSHIPQKEGSSRVVVNVLNGACPAEKLVICRIVSLACSRDDGGIGDGIDQRGQRISSASKCVVNERKMLDVGSPSTLKSLVCSRQVSPDS